MEDDDEDNDDEDDDDEDDDDDDDEGNDSLDDDVGSTRFSDWSKSLSSVWVLRSHVEEILKGSVCVDDSDSNNCLESKVERREYGLDVRL